MSSISLSLGWWSYYFADDLYIVDLASLQEFVIQHSQKRLLGGTFFVILRLDGSLFRKTFDQSPSLPVNQSLERFQSQEMVEVMEILMRWEELGMGMGTAVVSKKDRQVVISIVYSWKKFVN